MAEWGETSRDPQEVLDADVSELTDRELVLALGAMAQKSGEAAARYQHVSKCEQRRADGVLPALRASFVSVRARLSPARIAERKATAEEQKEDRDDRFEEYLAAATMRFDDTLEPTDADRGFW